MKEFKVIASPISWSNLLKEFEVIDCYYTYEYGSLFAQIEKGELRAAYIKESDNIIFYPFIERKISFLENSYDIVTPYGYGGPFIKGNPQLLKEFYREFETYCHKNNIITETIRFHPLYENYKYFNEVMDVDYIRKTVSVNLQGPISEIRSNYTSMTKRNIKKAKENGVICFVADKSEENINLFIDMYKETMDRNNADNYYYFKKDYFYNQLMDSDRSQTFLLFASTQNKIISGVMVLMGEEFAHYHLGASRTDSLGLKPNNALFDYMIEFCHNLGKKTLHLGGGYKENDGLFKFKSSFSNTLYHNYYIGKKVHNSSIYDEIVNGMLPILDGTGTNYFPIYRGIFNKKLVKFKM
jgi:lipid II:glycine glycyltransferase (peptidoglycan interpeptide bridge formation enzyme)